MSSTKVASRGDSASRALLAEERSAQTRRYYARTSASTIVPGLGLLATRRRSAQLILGGFALALLGALLYALTHGVTQSLISLGVSRGALLGLLALILLGTGAWVYGVVRTARDNFPATASGTPRTAMIVFAALACLLVFAPAAQAARYAVIQRDLLQTLFPSIAPDDATKPGSGDDPWAGTERVNVLLVGSDAGKNREGIRPDSLMVASVDTQTGDTVLFGIPRNLQDIPFSDDNPLKKLYPEGFNCGDQCLMEMVWTLGSDHKDLFPGDENPGLTVTKDAASQVLGLDIDYTTVVDLKGFTALVDAMGGVEIDVKERVCIDCHLDESGQVVGTTGYIEAGQQRLDGYKALWYSRSRAESADGDFSRMRRQRCMVGALLQQVNPVSMTARYPALAKVLRENVVIDIPQQDLDEWAVLVQRIQSSGSIKSLPLTNKNVNVVAPDYDKVHAMVDKAINPPPPAPKTAAPKPSTSTPSTPKPSPSSTPAESDDALSDLTATC